MANFNYLVPKGGGCHHPNLPKLRGTGPNCDPIPDAKSSVKEVESPDGTKTSVKIPTEAPPAIDAKALCISESQKRVTDRVNKVLSREYEYKIDKANAELAGYFNMCTSKQAAFCHVVYPDHVSLKQERLLRKAIVAGRWTAVFDDSALDCACTTIEEVRECICKIPIEQQLEGGATTRVGTEDSSGNCICEEPSCDCEVPSEGFGECEATNSSGCNEGSLSTTDGYMQVGTDPRLKTWEVSSLRKIPYIEAIEEADGDIDKIINLRPDYCMDRVCGGGDETDKHDNPPLDEPKETVPGIWSRGKCECAEPDEPIEGEFGVLQNEVEINKEGEKTKRADSDGHKDLESHIDLLPTTTVSLFDYPLEHIFGRHFLHGNILWVEKINKISSIEVALGTDYTASFGTPELFGSGTTIEQETSLRDMQFAVGLCATGVDAVQRVWVEGNLIYDETTNQTATRDIPVSYGGSTQKINQRMAHTVGFGRAPAYRDLVYIMLDREDIKSTPPQVRVEVTSNVESSSEVVFAKSPVSSPNEVTDDRIFIDYNQQKIFQSMSGGRLRVVDYVTLEEVGIIQFPVDVHMESIFICQKAEYFMAQMPVPSYLRPYGDAFFDKSGTMIYSPHEDIDTPHYEAGQTNDFLKKYSYNTRTGVARRYPILTTTIKANSYVVSPTSGSIRTQIVDDLFMYVRHLGTSSTTPTNSPQTLNAVNNQKMSFPGKGEVYVTGHLGATGHVDGVHMGIKVVQVGNSRVAATMEDYAYYVLPINHDELGIYAEDITIIGTIIYGNSAILFGHYGNCTKYFIAHWSMVEGIKWLNNFDDIIPSIGPDITLETSTFHFISAGPVPKMYTMNVATGAIRVTPTVIPLVPYKVGVKSWMFYDSELDTITYFTANNTFVNVFPTQRTARSVTVADVFEQIENSMRSSGANITFNGDGASGVYCAGFRTGSHLSWAAALANFATTYDLNIYEDEHISGTPNKANSGLAYPHSVLNKNYTSDDGAASVSSLSLQYYDANSLGEINFVLVHDPYLEDIVTNGHNSTFVSGGLIDSQYAYSLAEVLLHNKNNKLEISFESTVGTRATLVVPGERVFGPFLASRISTGKTTIQMSGPSSLAKAVEAPLSVQPTDGSREKFLKAHPISKPILVRSPLQPIRLTGYHSGKVGYQVGLADIHPRGSQQLLDGTSDTITAPLQWGRTLIPLKGVVNHFTTDFDNEVKVLFNVPPQVPPVDSTINGLIEDDTKNVLVCGTETVQFMYAKQDSTDPRVWTFRGLFRGRFGSEDGHEDHMLNELCVLNDNTTRRVVLYTIEDNSIFNKMSSGFLTDDNPTTNSIPNFPTFDASTSQLYRSRKNEGTMWAYDEIGRPFSPVNVERIDDPDTDKSYFIWKGRDPSEVWFKDTLLPYTKSKFYDFRLSPTGGMYNFSGIEDGYIYQYHQIERRYRARITQSDNDSSFGNNTTLRFGPGQQGLTTELGYLNPSTFGNPVDQQEYERHRTGVYVVDMSYPLRWGSLPSGYEWSWMQGYGLHREFSSGTKVLT